MTLVVVVAFSRWLPSLSMMMVVVSLSMLVVVVDVRGRSSMGW